MAKAYADRQQSSTALAEVRPIDRFKAQLKAAMPTVMKMLPQHVGPDQFESRVITAIANKPELLECDSSSLLRACAEAAELGLSLNPHLGEAWILRVWNGKLNNGKGGYEAQLRPGYIGLMKLARQSGEVTKIKAVIVYENDHFKHIEGLHEDLIHEPVRKDRGDPEKVYCYWELRDGTKQFEIMEEADVLAIKERSKSRDKQGNIVGPWMTDELEMWKKTVVRRCRKYMPQSPEMQKFHDAMARDNEREFGEDAPVVHTDYVDVTDTPADASPRPSAAARSQAKSLEDRIAPGSSEPQVIRIEPTPELDGPDWAAWEKNMMTAIGKLKAHEKEAFFVAHSDLIEAAPDNIAVKVGTALGHAP